jgi:DNA-binding SARP family transcriptional activator
VVRATSKHRFLARLAAGVPRSRIVDPILAARPRSVLLCAPSGYGKTAVAAQIALRSDADILWIDARGGDGAFADTLTVLANSLQMELDEGMGPDSVLALCTQALQDRADDEPATIVVDDARWVEDPDHLQAMIATVLEAPLGSMLIVTSRLRPSLDAGIDDWVVGPGDLALDDPELTALWLSAGGRTFRAAGIEQLATVSGRHPALAALAIREAELAGELSKAPAQESSALIARLVDSQLSSEARRVLLMAALLGAGPLDVLVETTARPDAVRLLAEASRVLPLVTVGETRGDARYFVHDAVLDALDGDMSSYLRPGDLGACLKALGQLGEPARALALAERCGSNEQSVEVLLAVGHTLVAGGLAHLVDAALGRLPRALTDRHDVLLLAAFMKTTSEAWTEASELATRAAHAAQVAGGDPLPARALRIQCLMETGKTAAALREADALPASFFSKPSPSALTAAVFAAAAAALSGDLVQLAHWQDVSSRVGSADGGRTDPTGMVDTMRSFVSGMLAGDWTASLNAAEKVLSAPHIPRIRESVALNNASNIMLYTGDCAGVHRLRDRRIEAAAGNGLSITRLSEASFYETHARALETGLASELDTSYWDEVCLTMIAQGDAVTSVGALGDGCVMALAVRKPQMSLAYAERGLALVSGTDSKVLLWQMQVYRACALAAGGDTARAAGIANGLLPELVATGARPWELCARLVLSADALRRGDHVEATAVLAPASDHIVDSVPALHVVGVLRCIPDLAAPLVAAVGAQRVPSRILALLDVAEVCAALRRFPNIVDAAEAEVVQERMRSLPREDGAAQDAAFGAAPIKVRLFGAFSVSTPRGVVTDRDWVKRKARLMFAMLVSKAGTDIPRDQVIEHLWPEMPADRALTNFYVVWSTMKRTLGGGEASDAYVEHAHEVCRVVPNRVESDLADFTRLLADASAARAARDDRAELVALEALTDTYSGELMPGDLYDDWFASMRDRCRHDFGDAAARCALLYEAHGEPSRGLALLRRAIEQQPWREDLCQNALRLLIATGQRAAAIELYLDLRARLAEEMGIDPSRETIALYERAIEMMTPAG